MPDLLLEVGCEELPSSACREIVEQVPRLYTAALAAVGLGGGLTATVSVAPRRFAVHGAGLPVELAAASRSVRGPAASAAFGSDGAPTRAAEGFARGQGIGVGDLVVRDDGGRDFVFAEIAQKARPLAELVPDIAGRIVNGLRFSKTMRWGAGTGLRFSRPVRWIVAKVGDRTIPFDLHGLRAGEVSQGHRFLGEPVTIASASTYPDDLRSVAVIAGHDERRATILAGLDAAALAAGGAWSDPGGKLEEVVFLVEWPSVITGRFDERHLRLPARVLVTAMQGHQRYFPLRDASGDLLPAFLAVSNGDPVHAFVITRGNEGVLDARLQDAEFSFDKDLEAGLGALDGRLDTIVFHKRLGTMADKRDRLVAGVAALADALGVDAAGRAAAEHAARLAKADQGAVLVAEFSELEGYVAAEYARREGVDPAVATAVEEQYLPEGPDSPLPSARTGALLAAAEKIDNLVGAFAVNEIPTGSKDPYGLRRAAMGLVRIGLDADWDIDLMPLLQEAWSRFEGQGADLLSGRDDTATKVRDFVLDRLGHLLGGEGVGIEALEAAKGAGLGSIPATATWARGVNAAKGAEEFAAVRAAFMRLAKVIVGEPSRAPYRGADGPDEIALDQAIDTAAQRVAQAREARAFSSAFAALAPLEQEVGRFFVAVMVNADDPDVKARRHGLVDKALGVFEQVSDFSKVTDGGGAR